MQIETVDGVQVREALTALRQELTRLGERVAALEVAACAKPSPIALRPGGESQPGGAAAVPEEQGLSDELILVLSAAIAAFLGKQPHIRQIRLVGTTTWAQQGRVTIEASHMLPIRPARGPS
jgi:methylmalonyl-CoA carboxyltransferase large subunit